VGEHTGLLLGRWRSCGRTDIDLRLSQPHDQFHQISEWQQMIVPCYIIANKLVSQSLFTVAQLRWCFKPIGRRCQKRGFRLTSGGYCLVHFGARQEEGYD